MAEFPNSARARLAAQQGADAHPDPDLLTAFAERTLSERERQSVFAHLAGCADCRDVLALITPAEGPPAAATKPRRAWIAMPFMRWAAVAAAVVVVGTAVLVRHERSTLPVLKQTAAPEQTVSPQPQPVPSDQAAEKKSEAPVVRKKQEPPAAAQKIFADRTATRDKMEQPAPSQSQQAVQAPGGALKSKQQPGFATYASSGVPGNAPTPTAPPPPPSAAAPSESATIARQNEIDRDMVLRAVPQRAAQPKRQAETAKPAPRMDSAEVAAAAPTMGITGGVAGGELRKSVLVPRSNWKVSPNGRVLRQIPPNAPEVIQVAEGVTFRAVATVWPDVWAAGNGGALFRSTDLGNTWSRIPLPTTDDIASLAFSTRLDGTLTTTAGRQYQTHDAGQTWVETKN